MTDIHDSVKAVVVLKALCKAEFGIEPGLAVTYNLIKNLQWKEKEADEITKGNSR